MEQKHLIYTGKLEDFCWAGFGSGSGTNLRECAKIIKPADSNSVEAGKKPLRIQNYGMNTRKDLMISIRLFLTGSLNLKENLGKI